VQQESVCGHIYIFPVTSFFGMLCTRSYNKKLSYRWQTVRRI